MDRNVDSFSSFPKYPDNRGVLSPRPKKVLGKLAWLVVLLVAVAPLVVVGPYVFEGFAILYVFFPAVWFLLPVLTGMLAGMVGLPLLLVFERVSDWDR